MDTSGTTNTGEYEDSALISIQDSDFYQSGIDLIVDSRTVVYFEFNLFDSCLNTVSGGGALFAITNSTVTLSGCTFLYCSASGGPGGAVYLESIFSENRAELLLDECLFSACSSTSSGGAIWMDGGNLEDSSSTFIGNHAAIEGGAIATINSSPAVTVVEVSLVDNLLKYNTASRGGALALAGYQVNFANSTLARNGAQYSGGAAMLFNCQSTFKYVIFSRNKAEDDDSFGGALFLTGLEGVSTASISDSEFIGNYCDESGGGASFEHTSVELSSVGFINNYCGTSGGGFLAVKSEVAGTGVLFTSNEASLDGGGYYCAESTVNIGTVAFNGNSAYHGDAYYCGGMCTSTLEDVSNPTNDTISCD